MFSLHLETSTSLYVSILQHLAALAVVHSIRTRPGYENLVSKKTISQKQRLEIGLGSIKKERDTHHPYFVTCFRTSG